ncbi:MAG: hypothetical protein ACKVYV_02715, partial [Limisphaerales bacterium]
ESSELQTQKIYQLTTTNTTVRSMNDPSSLIAVTGAGLEQERNAAVRRGAWLANWCRWLADDLSSVCDVFTRDALQLGATFFKTRAKDRR